MDYKKKYEKANNVLTKIQKMIDDHELDASEFCWEVYHLLREYNNNK